MTREVPTQATGAEEGHRRFTLAQDLPVTRATAVPCDDSAADLTLDMTESLIFDPKGDMRHDQTAS